jgi:hypothetical protein
LDQTGLGLGKSLAIGRVDCNIAEGSCAVILYINIRRGEEVDEDWNSTGVDKLLSVIIYGG